MTQVTENHRESKQQKWQNHIEAWRQSGLSQQHYCQANNIALATFGYWRRKLKHNQTDKPRFYSLMVPAGEPSVKNVGFPRASLRLVFGDDRFVIDIGESFSPAVLQKLITTLEEL